MALAFLLFLLLLVAMRLLQVILIVAFATLSITLPLQSNSEDLDDVFVRFAIQHRGNFQNIEREDRLEILKFTNAQHNQVEKLCADTSDALKVITECFKLYSPQGQILRTCLSLPKTLEDLSPGFTSELIKWKDRLRFLVTEKTNLELAHLSIRFNAEALPSVTDEFKSDLNILQKQLQCLINFTADLKDIFAGGIANKTEAYDEDIRIFSAELLSLKNNLDHRVDPTLIQKMTNRKLAISGTITFNEKILGFCRDAGDSLAALDKVFESLKVRYTSVVKILKAIEPYTNEDDYFGIFAGTQGFVGFHGIAQEILEKYLHLQKDLSKKFKRVENQLTIHHLLDAKARSTIKSAPTTDLSTEALIAEPVRRHSSSGGLRERMIGVLKRRESSTGTPESAKPSSTSSASSEDPNSTQE